MWSRILWTVGASVAALKNVQPCSKAYDKATGVFTTYPAHGLTNGQILHYTQETGGLAIAALNDKGFYMVSDKTATTFKLKPVFQAAGTAVGATPPTQVSIAGAALTLIAETPDATLAKSMLRPVHAVGIVTPSAGATTGTNDWTKYTQEASKVCTADGDYVEPVDVSSIATYAINGAYSAVIKGTAPHPLGATSAAATVYRCATRTGDTATTEFVLSPKATTTALIKAHANAQRLPNGACNAGAACVSTVLVKMLFINWGGATDAKKTQIAMCGVAAYDTATCGHVNGTAADKKQFWITTKCDVGSDANCKVLDADKEKWDSATNKCIKKTTSSATRVFASASIVALFGLMA